MELILIPLLTSAVLFFLQGNTARFAALGITLANLGVTLFRLTHFDVCGGWQNVVDINWIPQLGIHFKIGYDGISLLLVLLTNVLLPLIILSGWNAPFGNQGRFYGLALIMQAGLIGVFTSMDGLLFYIFWELTLIPIYFICAIWGGEGKNRITLKFFIYTFSGSLLMLLALIYLYLKTPYPHSFDLQALMSVASLPGHSMMIMGGLFAAFAIKMPVFPLHTWQPDTYTTSPTQGTMLLSGIMLKMGGYGAIRWMLPLVSPYHFGQYQMLFVILAVIGIVYASIIAIMQDDMKRLIAYSSIAHVGLIAAGVWVTNTEGLQGAMIQMVSHGINVVGLFYAVDIIERRTGTRSLAALGGLARTAPVFAALFMVVVLGATAVPLTNGFVGEFLLLSGVYKFNLYLVIVAGLTVILCSVYMLRLYGLAMFGETKPAYAGFKDLSATEMAVMGIVAILVILIGVAPQPLLDLTRTAATHLLQTLPH